MSEEKIQQLNMIESSLSQIISQKQQFQRQILEIESATNEIKDKEEAYQIVGSLMIKKTKQELEKDLDEKNKLYKMRFDALEKQEIRLKEELETLRKDLVDNLETKQV